MKCPLCGFEFKEIEAEKACKGCPFQRNCNLSVCPKCSYEFIASEPKSFKFLKRIFKKDDTQKKEKGG